jgi:teashirt-like protein
MTNAVSPPPSSSSSAAAAAAAAATSLGMSAYNEEALASMLKNPMFNPAALLGLGNVNPLYAVQLAQLQAAQLLSQHQQMTPTPTRKSAEEEALANFRKRKMELPEEYSAASGLNLSKKSPRGESPLDLSGVKAMAAAAAAGHISPAKASKMDLESFAGMPSWAGALPFLNPFLQHAAGSGVSAESLSSRFAAAAAAAASSSSSPLSPPPMPPTSSPSAATTLQAMLGRNPLDQMSEIAKTGSSSSVKSQSPSSANAQRHSAWQSQWINRGPQNTKDIFKCVWCKDSFPTLQALTTHMKETKHFGSNIPASTSPSQIPMSSTRPLTMPASSPTMTRAPSQIPSPAAHHPNTNFAGGHPPHSPHPPMQQQQPPPKRDILKEQLPMPRKLVRGQDVWLGRGEQQTRDILKCMWCGESFRSLGLMTTHMQETKHYTKVISQEQLVSWKNNDGSAPSTPTPASSSSSSGGNHVSSVLTCKICEQSFSTLKELSEHMVKMNHYKEETRAPGGGAQGSSSSTPSPSSTSPAPPAAASRIPPVSSQNNQSAKEKRKKSLPVRKLLELERAQQEVSGQLKPNDDFATAGKISCEKCGEKILMHLFVDHIRQCVGPLPVARSPLPLIGVASDRSSPSGRTPTTSPSEERSVVQQQEKVEPKSILGSLEKMVQTNFGAKKKTGPESNLSILQRLGIDEGVDYSKPLVDPMAMFRPPTTSAASVAAAFGFFPGMRGFAAAVGMGGGDMMSGGASSKTRSNSECSSPDRYKPTAEAAASSFSIKSAESPSAAAVRSPLSDIAVKSPASATEKNDIKEENLSEAGSVKDFGNEVKAAAAANESEKAAATSLIRANSNRSNSASPIAVGSGPASPLGKRSSPISKGDDDNRSTNGGNDEAGGEKEKDSFGGEAKKKKNSNPLAALQMLCDREKVKAGRSGEGSSNSGGGGGGGGVMGGGPDLYGGPTSDPGAILAFSWACNQAVVNDSLLKCPFCDTPFISKGAYRHHLSKMHFVKDGQSPDPKLMYRAAAAAAAAAAAGGSGPVQCPPPTGNGSGSGGGGGESAAKEENAQSKFQKYSQMAKQLSCAGQP